MIVSATPRIARVGSRLRAIALVLAALFAAHDAIYLARYGPGTGYAVAMSASGHDGYWLPASLLIVAAAAVAFLSALLVLDRLERVVHSAPPVRARTGPSYGGELVNLWPRLLVAVAVLFAIQENLEGLAAGGRLVGLDPLFGPDAWLVPPVLAITTLVLAAVGAVLRWRVRVLRARVEAARRAQVFGRLHASTPSRRWLTTPAGVSRGLAASRPDAGRAPPPTSAQVVAAA